MRNISKTIKHLNSKQSVINPFLKWPGGKRWLVSMIKEIVALEISDSGFYFEPFLGAGSTFLAISPKRAILSDINQELIDCIETVTIEPTKVMASLKKYSNTKEVYYKARASKPRSKVTAAARFIYLNRTCWGGIYRLNQKGEFNVPFGNSGRSVMTKIVLYACAELFSKASVQCADFDKIIQNATNGDAIYADPPYTLSRKNNGFIRYNDRLFSWDDQVRLSKASKRAKKKGAFVVISGLWHEDILGLYRGWWFIKIPRKTLISRDSEKRREIYEILLLSKKPCGAKYIHKELQKI